MAPTPYGASHQLDIHYTVDGLEHVVQIPVNSGSVGSPYALNEFTGGTILASAAAADYADLFKPLLLATDTIDTYVLQEYDSGIFIPVESGALGVAGTGAGTPVLSLQFTMTFRDLNYKIIKHVWQEVLLDAPKKYVYPATTPAPVDAFIASALDHSTAGALGLWMRSRGGAIYLSVTGATTTFNRKLRRARGFL